MNCNTFIELSYFKHVKLCISVPQFSIYAQKIVEIHRNDIQNSLELTTSTKS